MTEPSAEDVLLDRLRIIASQVDPPPAYVDELARSAFRTRHLDRLAEVLFDSAQDGALVRSPEDLVRMVTFAVDAVRIELEVSVADEGTTVRGYVTGSRGPVEIESSTTRTSVELDDDGWFAARGLPLGLLRLALAAEDGTPIRTAWFEA
jgi:hypothetical protein